MVEQTNRFGGAIAGRRISRFLAFALFCTAMAWVLVASAIAEQAARGIAVRFGLQTVETLMDGLFLLFLVVVGFRMLDLLGTRGAPTDEVLPLPLRAGWFREWGVGAAVGWGLCLFAVLPLLVSGNLHTRLNRQGSNAAGIALSLLALLVVALLEEAVFRGYPLLRLRQAVGPTWAAILLSLGFGIVLVYANPPTHLLLAVIDGTLFGLVLTMAYLRTHALWVGWGLHFAYRAVAAVALGLPIAGHGEFSSLVESYRTGPRWLSGGAFGLDAASLTAFAMLGAMLALYRATREYAWAYTHAPILAAGYEVTVAPPAAHVAMEQKGAAAPPPLVQIAAITPGGFSAGEAGKQPGERP